MQAIAKMNFFNRLGVLCTVGQYVLSVPACRIELLSYLSDWDTPKNNQSQTNTGCSPSKISPISIKFKWPQRQPSFSGAIAAEWYIISSPSLIQCSSLIVAAL